MDKKSFAAIILVLIPTLFIAGCIAQQPSPSKPTAIPSASPTVAPVTCTQNVYAYCPDGFKYLKAQCINNELKEIMYLIDPCLNHQLPTTTPNPSIQPSPTVQPTSTPTVTPSQIGCTQNVTKTCPNNGRVYLDQLCVNGVLIQINYFADPCSVVASPTTCISDSYSTCPDGRTYLSASCIDGVLYQVSYFKDPCA